jgi:transketolase
MNDELKRQLASLALHIRKWSVISTTAAGAGHPTSCLSSADTVATIFGSVLTDTDYFILSKGHAAPALYAAYHFFDLVPESQLLTLRHLSSVCEGHPTPRCPYVPYATGSLGQGLSLAVGYLLARHSQKKEGRVFVLCGDNEFSEGANWEALAIASKKNLKNLVCIIDLNNLGQSEPSLYAHRERELGERCQAFGAHTVIINGHDINEIAHALTTTSTGPLVIIARTIKGCGISHLENKEGFHGKSIPQTELEASIKELEKRFSSATSPSLPDDWKQMRADIIRRAMNKPTRVSCAASPEQIVYKLGQIESCRKAFGKALAAHSECNSLMVFDGDVKNSTFTEYFEKIVPDRFIQGFVAEQNMIGMSVGAYLAGAVPLAATFGCFLTRAHDQLRLGAIGKTSLVVIGTHAGISVGEDGPSQMALEDIAMMRALPESVVVQPADAQSTQMITHELLKIDSGIRYMRIIRPSVPTLYTEHEKFTVGDCKILRASAQDKAVIVASGYTVHEALKAYEMLQELGISVRVIDCYSIKPLPGTSLIKAVSECEGNLVIVEDHYPEGGLGETIMHALSNVKTNSKYLAVRELPRSGTLEELIAWAKIDAKAISDAVKDLLKT